MGVIRDKNAQHTRLCDRAFGVILKLRPYARRVGNQALLHAIDYGRTELESAAEAEVIQRCETIHAQGLAYLSALADYGLTQAELDALRADLDAFRLLTPARDQQRVRRPPVVWTPSSHRRCTTSTCSTTWWKSSSPMPPSGRPMPPPAGSTTGNALTPRMTAGPALRRRSKDTSNFQRLAG
jgi:hypothetical protein